jgi:hypothetical protein
MRRPFVTKIASHDVPGMLDVRIAFRAIPDRNAAMEIDAMRRRLFDLANCGALCGLTIAPERSGIGMARTAASGSTVHWRFSDVALDPRSATILCNLVHRLHDSVTAVDELYVAWDALEDVSSLPDGFPLARNVPFRVDFDDEEAASFDVIVDFEGEQPMDLVEQAAQLFGHWFAAVDAGAYGDDGSLPASNRVKFATEPMTVCPEALVWYIERFASTPQALDGLVNCADLVHRTGLAIGALTIEE